MIPDFPIDIRIRLAELIFFCCFLTLLILCPVGYLSKTEQASLIVSDLMKTPKFHSHFIKYNFFVSFPGNATELECRFVAIPEAEVEWFHNKKKLVETQRIKVENQADMHMYCSIVRISNVSKKDEGKFLSSRKRQPELLVIVIFFSLLLKSKFQNNSQRIP